MRLEGGGGGVAHFFFGGGGVDYGIDFQIKLRYNVKIGQVEIRTHFGTACQVSQTTLKQC